MFVKMYLMYIKSGLNMAQMQIYKEQNRLNIINLTGKRNNYLYCTILNVEI